MHGVHGWIPQKVDGEFYRLNETQAVGRVSKEIEIDARRNSPVGCAQTHRTARQWCIECRPNHRDPIPMRMKAGPGYELKMQVPRAPFLQVRAEPGTGEPVCPQALALSGGSGQRRPEIEDTVVLKIGADSRQVQHGLDTQALELFTWPDPGMQKQGRGADGSGRQDNLAAGDPAPANPKLDCRGGFSLE